MASRRSAVPPALLCLALAVATASTTSNAGSGAAAAPRAFPDAAPRFHDATRDGCLDCHVAHAALAPDLTAEGGAVGADGRPRPSRTLRAAGPLALCLGCHDGTPGVPDVVGEDVNGLRSRSAGFFDVPGRANPNGHDLAVGRDGAAPVARGPAAALAARAVTCVDCHDPHGNGMARLLVPHGVADPPPALGLFVDPAAAGLERYESDRVAFGATRSGDLVEASRPCLGCHAGFGGRGADPRVTGRSRHRVHPSWDASRGVTATLASGGPHGSTRPEHWEGGTGAGFESTPRLRVVVPDAAAYRAATRTADASSGVFCLTCHRAHGSDQPFGLAWDPFAGPGASGCEQCHAVSVEAAPAPFAASPPAAAAH